MPKCFGFTSILEGLAAHELLSQSGVRVPGLF
ncbi:uncharacterized protein METZ01_LOCUS141322, partial [marine metagenome]